MGGSSTKVVEVQVPVFQIENQLATIRNEVEQQQPLITKNVKQELLTKQDTMVLRYSDLKDKREISNHIQTMFKNEPLAVQFLTDAAEKMVTVFHGSSELKELTRWNQVKKVYVKAISSPFYKQTPNHRAIQAHYTLMCIFSNATDTSISLAYFKLKVCEGATSKP